MTNLNQTPSGSRLHISIFGCRNAGKSSLINSLTGQQAAIVSEVAGTTTDPVVKSMELLPLGPVIMTDTAGIDDTGELGALRVKKTLRVIDRTDIAILVIPADSEITRHENELLEKLKSRNCPVIIAINKTDLSAPSEDITKWVNDNNLPNAAVSSLNNTGIDILKKQII